MKLKLSKWKILIGIVGVSTLVFIGFLVKNQIAYNDKISKCPLVNRERYSGRDIEFQECYNTIAIEVSYIPKAHFRLYDMVHKYPIIGFKTFDFYRLAGDMMYVFNEPKEGGSYDIDENGKKRYFKRYFVNDEIQFFYYDTVHEMPRYFVIDTITGNVRLYRELSEVPVAEQLIFQNFETDVSKSK